MNMKNASSHQGATDSRTLLDSRVLDPGGERRELSHRGLTQRAEARWISYS